jgi:hypothetical protein
MFEFYALNGVMTPPAMVGVFTAMLMNSLHTNIIKPSSENVLPSHKLDRRDGDSESEFTNIDPNTGKIKWQTFMRDFIIWFISLFIFYILFKIIFRYKGPNNHK